MVDWTQRQFMSRWMIIAGISMLVASVTVYLIDVSGILPPLIIGFSMVSVGGLLSILDTD